MSIPPPYSAIPEPTLGADNYAIGDEVAYGGMGSILTATDAKLQRTVAAKVMTLRADTDASLRERFLCEAHVLAALEHPNIVPIHDLVWEDGVPLFYTMKMVKGRALQAILEALTNGDSATVKEFTLDRLLTIFRKVCDAIAFAHSKAVLHRDLKPANVMVGEFGEVLVMDWGLAKRRNDEWRMMNDEVITDAGHSSLGATLHGTIIGTPAYMPPEQAQGRNAELDERSDIYALGGILHAILVLRAPARDKVGIAMPNHALPHLPGCRVPAALAAVAMHALQPEPARRYASVLALAAEIEAYQNGFATHAESAGQLRQIWLLIKRHRTASAALLTILLLSVGFVLQLMASERKATRFAESNRQALARSQISLGEVAYLEADGRTMLAALNSVPEDLRDNDWRYLHERADTSQSTIKLDVIDAVLGVAPHPLRPGVFAVAPMDRTIALVEAQTGRKLFSFPLAEPQRLNSNQRGLDFSPDGTRLILGGAFAGDSPSHASISIYEVSSRRCLIAWQSGTTNFVKFSPDGSRTLDIDGGGIMTAHEAATGRKLWNVPTAIFAGFTTTGDVIAATNGTLQQLAGATGTVIKVIAPLPAKTTAMGLTPDDERLFIACSDGRLLGLRLKDGTPLFEQAQPKVAGKIWLALNAAGDKAVTACTLTGGLQMLRVWDTRTGQLLQSLHGGAGKVEGIAIHPLSDDVIVSGEVTRTWALRSRSPRWQAPISGKKAVFWGSDDQILTGPQLLDLQPDGKLAAAATPLPAECAKMSVAGVGGNLAAMGMRGGDGTGLMAVLRRSATGIQVLHRLPFSKLTLGLWFTADARYVSVADHYGEMLVLDTATGQQLSKCDKANLFMLRDLCWTEPDRVVGIGHSGPRGRPETKERVLQWDTRTGKVLHNIAGPCAMQCIAAAPAAHVFAEAGEDKRIRIRDAVTLEVLKEFRAHDAPITALAWHPTKHLLASGSADLTIRLWNPVDGKLMECLSPCQSEITALNFSPSGQRIAGCDANGVLRVWDFGKSQILK